MIPDKLLRPDLYGLDPNKPYRTLGVLDAISISVSRY